MMCSQLWLGFQLPQFQRAGKSFVSNNCKTEFYHTGATENSCLSAK